MVRTLAPIALGIVLGATGATAWFLLNPKVVPTGGEQAGAASSDAPSARRAPAPRGTPVFAALSPAAESAAEAPGTASAVESEFARRVANSGTRAVDPGFIPHMLDNLARGVGNLARLRGGQMLSLRCEARACMAITEWPRPAPGQPEPDPALLGPAVPGCTRDVQRLGARRTEAGAELASFAFHYQCPRWIAPGADQDPTQGASAPTPASVLHVPEGNDIVTSPATVPMPP